MPAVRAKARGVELRDRVHRNARPRAYQARGAVVSGPSELRLGLTPSVVGRTRRGSGIFAPMIRNPHWAVAGVLLLWVCGTPTDAAENTDWPNPANDKAGTRYAALDQINR